MYQLFKSFFEKDVLGKSAELSFFILLSILPILLFIVSLLPLFNIQIIDIIELFNNFVPKELEPVIESVFTKLTINENNVILSVSLILIFISSSSSSNSILKSINTLYDDSKQRGFLNQFVTSLGLTFSIIISLFLFLSVLTTKIIDIFKIDLLPTHIDTFLFSSLFLTITISLVYLFGPNTKIKIKSIIPGILFVIIGVFVLNYSFSFYLSYFNYYSIWYGSLSIIILSLFWIYILCIILISGGLINSYMHKKIKS